MLKIFQVVHVSGTSRVSFHFTHKSSKRNFTRLKFIKNIHIIPGYFKVHDKLIRCKAHDKLIRCKAHDKLIRCSFCRNDYPKIEISSILNELKKKNESNVLCGFFCPWWKNEERYFSWTNGYHGYFYLLF